MLLRDLEVPHLHRVEPHFRQDRLPHCFLLRRQNSENLARVSPWQPGRAGHQGQRVDVEVRLHARGLPPAHHLRHRLEPHDWGHCHGRGRRHYPGVPRRGRLRPEPAVIQPGGVSEESSQPGRELRGVEPNRGGTFGVLQ